MESLQLLQHIDGYLNAAPVSTSDVEHVGPFVLFFRRDSDIPEITYARPCARLSGDVPAHIAEVRAAFARRNRICRWEFIQDLAPELPQLLMQSGFPDPIPRPLMVVTEETFRPETSSIAEVRRIVEEEAGAVTRVLHEAFGMQPTDAAIDEEADLIRGFVARGATVIGAFVNGCPVAAGSHFPVGETTEVAGIGTAAAYRRQGIAGALTSALVDDAFARGCKCVFLSAMDETVQRVYGRIGFTRIGAAMDTADRSGSAS